jgi:hypothetical protein
MENELTKREGPKELSKDLFTRIRKEDSGTNAKYSGYLQVLEINEDKTFICVSDGHSYIQVALFKAVRLTIDEKNIKLFDVINATLFLHKATYFVLTAVEKVYEGLTQPIGAPVEHSQYIERDGINPDGNCGIPSQFWKVTKTKPTTELRQARSNALIDSQETELYTKISTLTAGQSDFMLKAVVKTRNEPKSFNSAKGNPTSVMNLVIADDTDEIQVSLWGPLVERYKDQVKLGSVCLFSGGEVRKANKFNQSKNPLEISFSSKGEIFVCAATETIAVKERFNFVKVGEIQKKDIGSTVDLVGYVSAVGELKEITLKNGEAKPKQEIKIKDDSNYEIPVNLWGTFQGLSELAVGDLVSISNLIVSEFKGRQLSSKAQTKISKTLPENNPRVEEVRRWGGAGGEQVKSLGTEGHKKVEYITTIAHLKEQTQDLYQDYSKTEFCIVAYVSQTGSTFYYDKCPNPDCYKKAQSEDNGSGEIHSICPVEGVVYKPPVPRFIGNIKVTDHTDSIFLNYSTDYTGEIIFGKSAAEVKTLTSNKEALQEYMKNRINKKFTFKVTVKRESYNNEDRIKYGVKSVFDDTGKKLAVENNVLLNTLKLLADRLLN